MTVTDLRDRRRRRQHEATAAFKACLSLEERDALEGPGTRTFDGIPLRWRSPDGRVHACAAAEVVPDTILVWTVCGRHDVPPQRSLFSLVDGPHRMSCPDCQRALVTAERKGRPAPRWRRAKSRKVDRPRDEDMVWWRRKS